MRTSVVMTTYNGRRFLPEMLDSLRDQTRKIDELLIFDDQSGDDTVAYIESYIEKNQLDNWSVSVNEKNLGWEVNFAQALERATGDVIFPGDQDDIWHLDKIERMTAAFEANDDIWLLISGYHAFSENGGHMAVNNPVITESQEKVSRVVFDKKYYQILRPGCTMALRRDLMPCFSEIWESGMPHDAALWTIAALLRRLYLYDEAFIEYRCHDNNASKKIDHGYKYKVNEAVRTEKINTWYQNSEHYDDQYEAIINDCNKWCRYRKALLIDKKFWYWFKLFPLRGYYLTTKKYIGDLYYWTQKA